MAIAYKFNHSVWWRAFQTFSRGNNFRNLIGPVPEKSVVAGELTGAGIDDDGPLAAGAWV